MTAIRNGTRHRYPSDILAKDTAMVAAAQVAAEVIDLTRKGLADRENGWHHISEARALAQVLSGLTGYVQMFERNP